ncbi:Single-stranded-DNA-specific exonuclease RecJ [hydrothermal vent metagenome]|uniref:Single-stranded-DNA-specific exonuclease RecJ n=1 Tax=hydrothermal vent metagenome TaxID=652676 RepID=A0A3B0VMR8_9ZZZZ
MIKKPKIQQRPVNVSIFQAAKQLGLTELQAKLVASRLEDSTHLEEIIFPKLKHIQHPNTLKNAMQASHLIVEAIQSDGVIVLATDYDTDGVTSAWVAKTALVHYFGVPEARVVHIIGERKQGYGITDEVVDRILDIPKPISLVISADQGSSDEPRIARLKDANIKVCVTDHHQLPLEGPPPSATCTVNPQQEGCKYDKTVAGCYVIFIVMTQVRNALIEKGFLSKDAPSLKALTMNVALGTVADSVSLKSHNNRAIVQAGLYFINQFHTPSWQAMQILNNNKGQPYDAEFLGFQVATRINAASRVSDVTTAFNFLTASSPQQAQQHLEQLDEDNLKRRSQQEGMLAQAKTIAAQRYHDKKYTLTIRIQGNAGIQGIIASRIGEQYGLPTIAMTDLEGGFIAGSGRGIVSSIDLREAFQWMADQHPNLFVSMGGHAGAAGCMIPEQNFDSFESLFEQAIQNQLGSEPPTPIIETDGTLEGWQLQPELIEELNLLEPYGREWPKPMFSGDFTIQGVKAVGQTKTHLSFTLLTNDQQRLSAIYFNAKESSEAVTPFQKGEKIHCVYQPSLNTYYGKTSLQLRLVTIQPL